MNSCDQSSSAAAAGAIVAAVAGGETAGGAAIGRLRRESRAGEENGMGDPSGTGRMRPAPGSGMEVAKVVRPRGCVKGTSTAQLLRLRPPFTARYPALGRARRRHDRAAALARRGRWGA